ncbi:hypothetical protein P7C71_g274, partial [Lecanoromycetidae sp. Uapishka_2]
MSSTETESQDKLIEQLTAGFGALLEQVQELAQRNQELQSRLTRVHKEATHLIRSNGPLSSSGSPGRSRAKDAGSIVQEAGHSHSAPSEPHETDGMSVEARNDARVIADGVEAWKVVTGGTGPVWRKWNRQKLDAQQSRETQEDEAPQGRAKLPAGHPAVDPHNTENCVCPFAAMSHLGESQDPKGEALSQDPRGSLSTPPSTHGHLNETFNHKTLRATNLSPPPSASDSVSKCPIRMLDERSPEEIAEYFEIHKHEIPRSHEICVKRYQSNAQSIRQLDAKYGNLVNMIQGLGVKHQPLLPTKEGGEEHMEMDSKSVRKVEKWAEHVRQAPKFTAAESGPLDHDHQIEESQSQSSMDPAYEDTREGHFDRPMKDIRVGESPSRPWGISVPAAGPTTGQPRESEAAPLRSSGQAQARSGPKLVGSHGTEAQMEDKPQMIFTGPVFIGYSGEQAAALIEKCGWDPSGPQSTKA